MQRTQFGELACSIARTLDVIGEPWSPLILRDVWVGIRRFDAVQADLDTSLSAYGYTPAHFTDANSIALIRRAVGVPDLEVKILGVSFWEAEAFCAWAGGRLPTEGEWEAAARGPKGLSYPWGDAWQDGICNTSEAELGVTSPVGLFPRARQADRAIDDLAGNVWEWCASLYGKDSRVLRGGTWGYSQNGARSADRYSNYPYDRNYYLGFRVVCVAHL